MWPEDRSRRTAALNRRYFSNGAPGVVEGIHITVFVDDSD